MSSKNLSNVPGLDHLEGLGDAIGAWPSLPPRQNHNKSCGSNRGNGAINAVEMLYGWYRCMIYIYIDVDFQELVFFSWKKMKMSGSVVNIFKVRRQPYQGAYLNGVAVHMPGTDWCQGRTTDPRPSNGYSWWMLLDLPTEKGSFSAMVHGVSSACTAKIHKILPHSVHWIAWDNGSLLWSS